MPPNSNLEQQLGEVNGQLKMLVPSLENLGDQQTEMGKELAVTKTVAENTAKQLDQHRESSGDRFAALNDEVRGLNQAAINMTKEIQALKEKVEQKEKRGWEIALIFLSGIIGAVLTWLAGRLKLS
jgi:predicted  nucleic acid-binding Zn-ribbon protein